MSARERNLRRLESNERERLRMHSLNTAFQVTIMIIELFFDIMIKNLYEIMRRISWKQKFGHVGQMYYIHRHVVHSKL